MYRKSFRLTNAEIDAAFAGGHFRLAYQPKFALTDGRLIGAEAYARWHHPAFGVIPPALFLPVFARQGRSQELTRFVLREAVACLADWQAQGRDLTMSINVAPEELADGSLAVSLGLALSGAEVPRHRLIIDLPERGLAETPDSTRATISALREIGVSLALECASEPADGLEDLAGTGFCELKIGGSAIIQFAERIKRTGLGIMEKRLAFARDYHLLATAVGAETPETIAALKRMGFAAVQGNAIAAADEPDAIFALDPAAVRETLGLTPKVKTGTASPPPADLKDPAKGVRKPARIRVVRGPAQISFTTDEDHHASHSVLRVGQGEKKAATVVKTVRRKTAKATQQAQDAARTPAGPLARLGRSLSRALFS